MGLASGVGVRDHLGPTLPPHTELASGPGAGISGELGGLPVAGCGAVVAFLLFAEGSQEINMLLDQHSSTAWPGHREG